MKGALEGTKWGGCMRIGPRLRTSPRIMQKDGDARIAHQRRKNRCKAAALLDLLPTYTCAPSQLSGGQTSKWEKRCTLTYHENPRTLPIIPRRTHCTHQSMIHNTSSCGNSHLLPPRWHQLSLQIYPRARARTRSDLSQLHRPFLCVCECGRWGGLQQR